MSFAGLAVLELRESIRDISCSDCDRWLHLRGRRVEVETEVPVAAADNTTDCFGGGVPDLGWCSCRSGRVPGRWVLMLVLGSVAERRGAAWPETVAAGRSVARS